MLVQYGVWAKVSSEKSLLFLQRVHTSEYREGLNWDRRRRREGGNNRESFFSIGKEGVGEASS